MAVLLLLSIFVAVRMFTDISLLLRNLATDCLPVSVFAGTFLPTRCLAMGVHVALLNAPDEVPQTESFLTSVIGNVILAYLFILKR
jgi:hypothetical protein